MTKKNNQTSTIDKELLEIFELEKWSNSACCGYAIKACESAGLEREIIGKIIHEFRVVFEEYTVKQAEKIYYNY